MLGNRVDHTSTHRVAALPLATSGDLANWYALRVRAQQEKVVHQRVQALGVASLLPTTQRVSRWHDRRKIITEPVFKGYCFAQVDLSNRLPLLQIPGVVGLVSAGSTPVPLEMEDVHNLLGLLASGRPLIPHPFLTEGQPVQVQDGPLTGLTGLFIRRQGDCRLVIGVQLIGQSVSVEIDADQVEPLDSTPHPGRCA